LQPSNLYQNNPYQRRLASQQPAQTGIGTLLESLTYPQRLAFGAAIGRPLGETAEISDVYRRYGITSNPVTRTVGEVVLDPINLIGIGPLTRAGKVLQRAGKLDDAGRYLTRAAQLGKASPQVTQRAAKGAQKLGKRLEDLSRAEIAGMPTVRPRAARRFGSIEQVASGMDNAEDAQKLIQSVEGKTTGLFGQAPLKQQQLTKDIGIGLPFMRPIVSMDVPGGRIVRDAMDAAVLGAKTSRVGRGVRQALDKTVDNAFALDEQILSTGAKTLAKEAELKATAEGIASMTKLRSQVPEAFETTGARALTRLIEKPKVNPLAAADEAFEAANPAIKEYMDWWSKKSDDLLTESESLGIGSKKLVDENVEGYLPRIARDVTEDPISQILGESPAPQRTLSPSSPDQMARADFTKIPGGKDRLAYELANPETDIGKKLVGGARSAANDDEAADVIGQALYGNPKAKREDTKRLATLLSKLDPKKMGATGLFQENPTTAIAQYTKNRTKAIENAKSIADYMGSKAVKSTESPQTSVTVREALKRGGLQNAEKGAEGAMDIVRDVLGRRFNIDPKKIDLTEFSVPMSAVEGVTNLVKPKTVEQQGKLFELLNYVSRIWRNSILSFPSRYARDVVGGIYANFLESASSRYGYTTAHRIMRHGIEKSVALIRKIPAYSGIEDNSALVTKFYSDLAGTGLMESTLKYDLGRATTGVTLPGLDKIAPSLSLRDVTVGLPKNIGKMVGGSFFPDSDFAKGANALNDYVDTFSRLAGYTELMRQGFDPAEAAKRMLRTHVDYANLSDVEKQVKKLYPFYTYTSRITGETARKLVSEPRRLVGSMKAFEAAPEIFENPTLTGDVAETDSTYIPKSRRENFAVPLSSGPEGLTTFGNIDLPGFREINRAFSDGGLLSMTTDIGPLPKAAIEQMTGRDLFTGGPISRKRGPLQRVTGSDNELVRYADAIGEQMPLVPRFGRLAANLLQDSDTVPLSTRASNAALNALTGFRRDTYTPDELNRQRQYEMEDELRPYMSTFENQYVPEDVFNAMSPAQQRQYELLKKLRYANKKARERRSGG